MYVCLGVCVRVWEMKRNAACANSECCIFNFTDCAVLWSEGSEGLMGCLGCRWLTLAAGWLADWAIKLLLINLMIKMLLLLLFACCSNVCCWSSWVVALLNCWLRTEVACCEWRNIYIIKDINWVSDGGMRCTIVHLYIYTHTHIRLCMRMIWAWDGVWKIHVKCVYIYMYLSIIA